jgi:2-haloacid dehalogenase
MIMVAAHDWDLMGARAVGARTAFIRRPGSVWSYPGEVPDYEGGDLIEVASQIIDDLV